jgi:chromosome segregation ATPase
MTDKLREIILSGGSVRTNTGEVVTDVEQLDAALARELEVSTEKRPSQFPSRDDLQSMIDNLQPENATLKSQVAELTDQLQSMTEQNTKLADAATEAANEIKNLTNQCQDLQGKANTLQETVDRLTAENESLKKQIDDAPTDLNNDGNVDDLEKMGVPALKDLAKSIGIDGADGLKKADLIDAIRKKSALKSDVNPAG